MDVRRAIVAALLDAMRQMHVVCGERGVLDGAKITSENELVSINRLVKLPDGCRFTYDVNFDRLEEILRAHIPMDHAFWATERDYIRLLGRNAEDRTIRLRCENCPNKVNGCRVTAQSTLDFPTV